MPDIATVVAPLVYAVSGAQSGTLLRHYKDDISPAARKRHTAILTLVLFNGITLHERCIGVAAGVPVTLRVTIPSLSGRRGVHPFTAISHDIGAITDAVQLVPAPTSTSDRVVVPTQFALNPPTNLAGHHVLVLDDTWTTGARAQSAAMTLRAAGASAVSIMVVGRWIEPGFGSNAAFIRERLTTDFDPDRCPVTGDSCPSAQ
ncbi:ComF family protein [Nocardia arizonensis]|uniref:ComF family protein n=1 Tax=Nocardia arizonensis TaxID=1141647 RepID=UPI0012E264D7|nr:phosphoribosyltransferase [Nocardia arizonensis]